MADHDLPSSLTRLTFHGPLSEARAGRLADRLTRARPGTVLDIGCGWGELMLRILSLLPDATGLGFDTDETDLARGRNNARARGLAGRVLLGEAFWQRHPTEAELAGMWPGTSGGELLDLAALVDVAVDSGFRPAWIETATLEEWEDFESGYQCDEEEWLAAHAGHQEAARIRAQVDVHRSHWLRGYRGVLGQAYLTLVPVG